MSCDDTSLLIHLVSEENLDRAVWPQRVGLFRLAGDCNTNTKFCQTKLSIFISKGTVLLACVAVLVRRGVVAATIRHHPEGCGLMESQNCSLACLNSSSEVGSVIGERILQSHSTTTTRISPSVTVVTTMPRPSPVLRSW